MSSRFKKISLFFLAISILIAGFSGGIIIDKKNYQAQASLLDAIRAWVTINPLEVDVSSPAEAEINKTFKVTVEATNKGEEKIENVQGKIFLSEGLVLLNKKPIKKIGIIQGKKSKKISWTVRGTNKGEYGITASVTGELKGNLISAEGNTEMIEIKDFIEKPRPRKWYQSLFDFFRGWFDKNK